MVVVPGSGTPAAQQITVPAGATSAVVYLYGGAGDQSDASSDRAGAFVTGTLSVIPGEVLTVGAGLQANSSTGGWGPAGMSGGSGGGHAGLNPPAGGGGGASAILDGTTPLVVAGGGGGNGAAGIDACRGYGGTGGPDGSSQLNGTSCSGSGQTIPGGTGGAQSTGQGQDGLVSSDAQVLGGGGGGGGYRGGSGGGAGTVINEANTVGGGGGGAGSSWVDLSRVTRSSIVSGTLGGEGSVTIFWMGPIGAQVPANGQTQAITVPARATAANFIVVGGGGGSTGGIGNAGHGGNGGEVVGTLAVTPGQTFLVTAGGQGVSETSGGGKSGAGGVGLAGYTGGAGGSGGGDEATGGGGGGTASVVQTSDGTPITVAGGGGGAGAGTPHGGTAEHGNGGDAGATADNGSKGFGIDGGGAGKGGYMPTGVGQSAASDTYDFVGGGGGGGVKGGSAGTAGGGDGLGTGGGGGAGSSMVSSTLTNTSIMTDTVNEDGVVFITWTMG